MTKSRSSPKEFFIKAADAATLESVSAALKTVVRSARRLNKFTALPGQALGPSARDRPAKDYNKCRILCATRGPKQGWQMNNTLSVQSCAKC